MRKMRKKMEDEHHKRSAAHKTTQEDLANYHSKINATDDIGELLKEHRRNEDKLKNMEKTKKAEQEQRFKERQQAEKEAKEGIAALKWFAPKQKEKKESTKAMAEALRANLHAFYDMMQMTQHVRKELGKIFIRTCWASRTRSRPSRATTTRSASPTSSGTRSTRSGTTPRRRRACPSASR